MKQSSQGLANKFLRSQLTQDIVWLYCIHFLNYLVPLLMIPYLVRILGATGWGFLSFTLSFSSFVSLITEYGFYVSGQREAARFQDDREALSKLFSEVLCAKLLMMCLVATASLIGSRFIPVLREAPLLLLGALCFGITQALSLTWYFRGIQRIQLAAGMEATAKGLSAILVVLIIKSPADVWKYCYAFAASQLGVMIWGFWCASRDIRLRLPVFGEGVRALRRAGHLFLLHAIGSIFTTSSMFVLGLLAPPHVVGYYAGAEKIVRYLASAMDPVRHALFPRLSYLVHYSHREAHEQVSRVLVVTGGMSLLMGCLVYVFAPGLMSLVLGNDFFPAIHCLELLALLIPISTLNSGLGFLWMLPRGYERSGLIIVSLALITNLILASLLVPTWQHIGMAVAVLISESVLLLCFWRFFAKD